jgi:tyrosinase
MTVNFGPFAPIMPELYPIPRRPERYNPRCLQRDISANVSRAYTKTEDIYKLITTTHDIASFQDMMQDGGQISTMGVHGGGHFTVSGDPGGVRSGSVSPSSAFGSCICSANTAVQTQDFYISPGDPGFWLHHAQVDRVWTIWQNLDPEVRLRTIAGTRTMLNRPPSANGTVDDPTDLGPLAGVMRLGDLLSSMDGIFCYRYE